MVAPTASRTKKHKENRPAAPRFRIARLAVAPNFAEQQAQIIRRAFQRVCFAHVSLSVQTRLVVRRRSRTHAQTFVRTVHCAKRFQTGGLCPLAPADGWPEMPLPVPPASPSSAGLFVVVRGYRSATPRSANSTSNPLS